MGPETVEEHGKIHHYATSVITSHTLLINADMTPWSPALQGLRAMDYRAELERQRSCYVGNGRRWSSGFSREFDDELEYPSARATGTRWRGWWRRIIKEKRRIFNSAAPMQVPYDPCTYAQNFDEGSASVEPENLSRSFSARFAVPSGPFQRVRG